MSCISNQLSAMLQRFCAAAVEDEPVINTQMMEQ